MTWFFYDSRGRLVEARTFDKHGLIDYTDQYEYTNHATLPLIKRHRSGPQNQSYIIGGRDSVAFSSIEFNIIHSAGTNAAKEIKVKNLTRREVRINIVNNPLLNINPVEVLIAPGDSTVLDLKIKVPEGSGVAFIGLESQEWKLDMPVKYLGYHLSGTDFDSGRARKFPRSILFYRDSEDYELQISGPNNKRTIPISKQVCEIALKKGKYQFTLIGMSGRKTLDVEVR